MGGTYLLVMRCPVYRWRESHPGFRTELENLAGDGKGKVQAAKTARLKVPIATARGGLLRNSEEAG
jgi:hypothetical protein